MRGEVRKGRMRDDRGVALIIVLLVTALLLALIFEFAYGTRISLRAAVNFRDSERAYFLARSGVHLFGKFKDRAELEGVLPPQGEWGVVPVVSTGDTELRIRWEDESGKMDIHQVIKPSAVFDRLSSLFTIRGVDQGALDRMSDWMRDERRSFYLLTELHGFLSDEDFLKVRDALTVTAVPRVNINTASADVLRGIGLDALTADNIIDRRAEQPFKSDAEVTAFLGPEGNRFVGLLTTASTVFKVDSFATVGGYTKQVEAVITKAGAATTVNYWRAL